MTLTYTPANGEDDTVLTISTAVATGEHVALDLDAADARLVATSGTRTAVTPTGTWPTLDPSDATSPVALPTLTLSSGSGLWMGRRRWRL